MIVSVKKTIVTSLRHKIEILGYRNDFGFPSRDADKVIATLAFPARHVSSPLIMMMRCIGLAVSLAGSHLRAHQCIAHCYAYYRLKSDLTDEELSLIHPTPEASGPVEGLFRMDPEILRQFTLDQFPSIYEIREMYSRPHKDDNNFHPMWNRDYFLNDPTVLSQEQMTLSQYELLFPHYMPQST